MTDDIEKAESRSSHPDNESTTVHGESGFEPIRTGAISSASTRSARHSRSRSLSRPRSHNGYSCDDYEHGDDSPQGGVAEKEVDPYEVAFDGGDSDPMCPRSMGKFRKWLVVSIVSCASFCVTAASSIYTSTYGQMDAEFGNSRIVATIGLSTFVLGISLGPMFLSPLSEFCGRRPIYIVSWSMYLIWLIPSAVAQNIATMIVARFFDGLSGSAFLAVSGGTVSDLFARHELQAPMLMYSLAPFIGPCIGPLIGGFINYNVDWRWTYYVLIIWAFALLVAIVVFVPETYHPIVLRNKAREMRKETGDERWKAPVEKTTKSVIKTIGISLMRPFQLLAFEPMVLSLDVFSAILLGILYLFFGAFPLVFGNVHGLNLWQVGLTFMGILVGMFLAAATDPLWHHIRSRLIADLEKETGVEGASEPEFRLPAVICGAFLCPIGIFWFGWSLHLHWIMPVIGSAIFGAGTLLVFTGIFTFLVDAYPLYAASALASNAFVRCMFAAAFPLFGTQMYNKLGYSWASSLLAFLTVAMLPFPFIFFKYGKRIRGRSRFATRG
ncbi:major facilitator superfamily transporter [Colletotrichum graminicola]|uniref:Major facilitator superfamily transporter n=1 Tax=Colletotrichum graminicola (strain M1.001 / M2 / FGSC 10212) TaxID=645133 RepID=E3QH75_COLGM|nr:major facilitator superfamily transporter [Colletotrichum graminicola M1.001]EFQ30237.1 major facilitator superfamily transporter [Colletotrichum graminicola M1.001]WDK09090.1 major facilitator superfamily transporter [Colletotrichum graminicola]